jgi:hypothetical protein
VVERRDRKKKTRQAAKTLQDTTPGVAREAASVIRMAALAANNTA